MLTLPAEPLPTAPTLWHTDHESRKGDCVAELRLVLPPALPDRYLTWMAFWREVERKMVESPQLAEVAAEESRPFLHDPVADFLSERVVAAISRQAHEARSRRASEVSPVVEGDEALLRQAMEYVAARGRWLQEPGVAEAMGIDPLEPDLVDLRNEVLASLMVQLTEQAQSEE
jgi:hypothetical protein